MTDSQITWTHLGLFDLSTSHPLRQGGKGPLGRSHPRLHTIPINDCFFAKFTLHTSTWNTSEYRRPLPACGKVGGYTPAVPRTVPSTRGFPCITQEILPAQVCLFYQMHFPMSTHIVPSLGKTRMWACELVDRGTRATRSTSSHRGLS